MFSFGQKRLCVLCDFVPRGVFLKSMGGWVLKSNPVAIDIPAALCECSSHIQQSMWYAVCKF